jgi:putative ABC transport system substrate-binding protein
VGVGLAAGAGVFRSDAAAPRLPHVGYLALHRPDEPAGSPRPYLEWFHEGLKDAGYVDGRNVVVEHRFAEGSAERLSAFAEELWAIF